MKNCGDCAQLKTQGTKEPYEVDWLCKMEKLRRIGYTEDFRNPNREYPSIPKWCPLRAHPRYKNLIQE